MTPERNPLTTLKILEILTKAEVNAIDWASPFTSMTALANAVRANPIWNALTLVGFNPTTTATERQCLCISSFGRPFRMSATWHRAVGLFLNGIPRLTAKRSPAPGKEARPDLEALCSASSRPHRISI